MSVVRRGKALTKAMFASGSSATATAEAPGGSETWQTLGPADTVAPGRLKAFSADGPPVAVANVSGSYYAFDDTCTHKRCSLADGDLDGTTVTCICHGSEFDVTSGAVLQGPAETPVGSYPVRVEGADLQIRR